MDESGWEIRHCYGERVHILSNPYITTLLGRLGGEEIRHPQIVNALRAVYRFLVVAAAGRELPVVRAEVPTRMHAQHPNEGVYRGPVLDPGLHAVVVDVIRGGIVPAQETFELLTTVLPDERVRLDHLSLERKSDSDGKVVGVELGGVKVGGTVENAYLFVPDPMGATGSTIRRVLEHYREHHGDPGRVVVVTAIATPEFLRNVLALSPELVVYSARLDRGLSPPDVLEMLPGADWARERGLNDQGYIVPGAGGMGEVLNNSWC